MQMAVLISLAITALNVQPLNFIREIDGTVYAVRAFFKEDARENITDKVQRIILKSDDNNKEI